MNPSPKALIRGLCPPLLWELARRSYRRLVPLPPPPITPTSRALAEIADIDAEIARAADAFVVSHDAGLEILGRFHFRYPDDFPTDPMSPEYRQAQFALYHHLSGRADYHAETCETTTISPHQEEFPFPYWTHSCRFVGGQLMLIGFLIQTLDLPRGGRILELGPGYGKVTLELAQMGFDVTAVDIYAPFLDLIERRCRALGRPITTVRTDMLAYRPDTRFDRVLFFECFHHCSDHARMIARLDELVADGGAVVFAGEPIEDDFPVPWGLHPGGQALWAIRRHGWLEQGFRTDYFLDLLARHGWRCEMKTMPGWSHSRVFVARRA